VLKEKFEALTPKFREAQQAYREAVSRAKAFEKKGMKGDDPEKTAFAFMWLVDELFDVKVLDPAMGSGHFLVEAVDFITDKMIDFLNGFPWNPVMATLRETRETILKEMEKQHITIDESRLNDLNLLKRHVLKRCIYGVDLNPMAVELAKVSLWLDCFTLGAPLSFLDHHLKCGNSLIGANEKEFEEAQKGQMNLLARSQFAGAKLAVGAMIQVGATPDITSAQARESRKQYNMASAALTPIRRLFDIYLSQWFGNNITKSGKGKNIVEHNPALEFLRDGIAEAWAFHPEKTHLPKELDLVARIALNASKEKMFFHWDLEFPEVFYGPRSGTTQVIERRDSPGFDAVIGNPPYDVFMESQYDLRSEAAGTGNLFGHFIIRGVYLTKPGGSFSFVVPLSLSCGSDYEEVRRTLYKNFGHLKTTHYSIRPAKLFPDVDQRITIFVAKEKGKVPCIVESSRLYRFHEGEQAQLVLNAMTGIIGPMSSGYIPRVSNETGASIYKKFLSIETTLADCLSKDSEDSKAAKWWFHSVGRYWLKAYDSVPYFTRDGVKGISTNLHGMSALSNNAAIVCVGVINSDLFYFWWIMQSDEFHLLSTEITSMPIPEGLLSDVKLINVVKALMNNYQKNALRKSLKIKNTIVEMDEIHARKSRPLILEIDKILAPHYGLNDNELIFLQTYDEKFRCGVDEE
jgi:hypothetical protein